MRPTAPGFTRGQTLNPTAQAVARREYGSRPSTQAEKDSWYASQTEPHDCAGEPWIHSGTTAIPLTPEMRLVVIHGRCVGRSGWHSVPGCCHVHDEVTGETFTVRREFLQVA